MDNNFKKTNAKGKPLTCKFCHAELWWHKIKGRWYDVGGETLHVENCELRSEHYKREAAMSAESIRQGKL